MDTNKKLIAKYNEMFGDVDMNLDYKLGQEIHHLTFQRLRELIVPDKAMSKYLNEMDKLLVLPQNDSDYFKYLFDVKKSISNSPVIRNYIENNPNGDKKIEKDFLDYNTARLCILIEVFDSDDLNERAKLVMGPLIKRSYQIILDLFGEVANDINHDLEVVAKRIKEIESSDGSSSGLYYWPTGAVPFDQTMEDLKNEGFILDITLAREIFKAFHNRTGQTLKWNGSKRELIYFLLLLYGGRKHFGETITNIAYKIFTLKSVCPRKQFTSDIIIIEDMIETRLNSELGPKFYYLKNILSPIKK